MRSRTLTGVLSGLTIQLVAIVPALAQESKPADPPRAVALEPGDGPETPGKAEQGALKELQGRMETARRELQLLEAQAAVKRAEVQRADAELRVFLLQHPQVESRDPGAVEKTVRSHPEIVTLREQIELARHKFDESTRK